MREHLNAGFPEDGVHGKILFLHQEYGYLLGAWMAKMGAYGVADVNIFSESMGAMVIGDEEKEKIVGWVQLDFGAGNEQTTH